MNSAHFSWTARMGSYRTSTKRYRLSLLDIKAWIYQVAFLASKGSHRLWRVLCFLMAPLDSSLGMKKVKRRGGKKVILLFVPEDLSCVCKNFSPCNILCFNSVVSIGIWDACCCGTF